MHRRVVGEKDMSLTKEQIQVFSEKGFIVLKKFFDKDVMEKVSAWLDELEKCPDTNGHAAKYYEKSPVTGEDILVRVEHVLGDRDPDIAKFLLEIHRFCSRKKLTTSIQVVGRINYTRIRLPAGTPMPISS